MGMRDSDIIEFMESLVKKGVFRGKLRKGWGSKKN